MFSVASEWLKQRRSLAGYVVIGSACFVPSIVFLSRFRQVDALPGLYRSAGFWDTLWRQSWEAMALMILPMAVMLLASLLAQVEYRSNAWKQTFTTPQPIAAIFAAKLAVLLALVAGLIACFNAAIYAAGTAPALLFAHVPYPVPVRVGHFLARDLSFFADVLPIVSLQFVLAILLRSFLAPLAIGMALWVLSVGTISWQYSWTLPYSAATLDYLLVEYRRPLELPVSPPAIASAYAVLFTGVGYVLYARKRER